MRFLAGWLYELSWEDVVAEDWERMGESECRKEGAP